MANRPSKRSIRRGVIAVMFGLVLLALMGLLAITVDFGYILTTRTSLQAAVDSSALAGGTELMTGLGANAPREPWQARFAARARAVEYAGKHRAGERESVYADPLNDVQLGNAVFNPDFQRWERTWGAGPFNLIGVTLRRTRAGSDAGDGPLPLFFAPMIGSATADVSVRAESVLLPIEGFKIDPGDPTRANVIPFAYDKDTWDQLMSAQELYEQTGVIDESNPIFQDPGGNLAFTDDYTVSESGSVSKHASDRVLEANFYPYDDKTLPAGNRGTVDVGDESNSTSDIERQIIEGLNDEDLSFFVNNEIVFDEENPLWVQGDTGLSVGFKDELNMVVGEDKVVPLFRGTSDDTGNNTMFALVGWAGITIVDAKLTSGDKTVLMQPSRVIAINSVPDLDGQISDTTTAFHPLILIE